ncbi:hypothetical protein PACTADRAFT_16401 [Pachysolen tannophilus NRRL Y-2460]|uniref:RRM domain-containing protein n=1 Tax=Pachysolen tannophilus NRRL Y-2460 TaxID=669874 RepID=A0A1E4TX74_PACTA|nr:hypothetical protein PACTADRAFT_16401 [Pachysolen tannophilus NRRL Y-2460]
MSNGSDDDDGLFDDIYGDDDVDKLEEQNSTADKKEEKADNDQQDSKRQSDGAQSNNLLGASAAAALAMPQLQPNQPLVQQALSAVQPPPPPPPPIGAAGSSLDSVLQSRASISRDAGKMFIGGLNWETTEESLRNYFEKYGEIIDLTIMKDTNTGKSRGFGFLTFKDSSSVDEVVKSSHVLDGKLIDPKRAIPKEEQEKTGKIFVGGIAPEVNEKDFNDYFSQFGNIIDAQLMIDKDTGRSRGFGFVTYDSPDAVDKVTENKYVMLKGRNMEIKRAEPRGQQNSGSNSKYFQQQQYQSGNFNQAAAAAAAAASGGVDQISAYGNYSGMTPDMMQQYWQQMQQYWMQMQQQFGMNAAQSNPMMQQMQQQYAMMSQQMSPSAGNSEYQQNYNNNNNSSSNDNTNSNSGTGNTGDDASSNNDNNSNSGNDNGYDQDSVPNPQQQQLEGVPKQPRAIGQSPNVPPNAPKGPKNNASSSRGGFRGRHHNRGGYRHRGGYHPYGR